MALIMVGLGGLSGSVFRFLVFQLLRNPNVASIPFHTVLVNLVGSFLIGILLVPGIEKSGDNWFLFLVPGFLGGFTTYSAFSSDLLLLLKDQNYSDAFIYFSLTSVGGIVFAATGYLLGRFLFLKAL